VAPIRRKPDVVGLKGLQSIARRVLPTGMRQVLRYAINGASELKTNLYLTWLQQGVWHKKPGSLVRFLNYTVRINDGPNFYILYKDIFIHRIYHFEA